MATTRKGGRHHARRWLIGLLLVAAASALGVSLIPAERIGSRIASMLTDATGAEVTVGKVQLSLVGGLGVRLAAARVHGSGGSLRGKPSPLLGDFDLMAEVCDVSLAVWPLLQRRLVIDGVRLRGSGSRALWRDVPVVLGNYDIRVGRFSLDLATASETGPTPGEAATAPGHLIPADLTVDFDLEAAQFGWGALHLEHVLVRGAMRARVLNIDEMAGTCGGGLLSGEAAIDYAADPWGALSLDVTGAAVPAAQLLPHWAPDLASQLETDLDGRVRIRCPLENEAVMRAGLTADGRLKAGEGVLHAGPWLGAVEQYLGRRRDLVEVRFENLEHVFRVVDGRYLVDTLMIKGPDTEWTVGGALSLDGALDVGVNVRLPAGFTPDLGALTFFAETLRDAEGRVNLDFRLTGPGSNPAVSLDLSRLSRSGPTSGAAKPGHAPQSGLGAILDKWKSK